MLELLENHSVPERTIDLRAHGQLEDIDSLNLNHFTRRGLRSPKGSLMVSCAPTDNCYEDDLNSTKHESPNHLVYLQKKALF